METKYIAIVYDVDMNDALKKANIIASFQGMKADDNGRYSEMQFHEVGFDYPTWKELRDTKYDIDYIDDENNLYSLTKGRCNNLNLKVKIKDAIADELQKADAIREQLSLKAKYAAQCDGTGVTEYNEKKTKIVPNKKANSLVACDEESDLVLPFREVINNPTGDKVPIFVYLHDKKSRGSSNATLLLKECKSIIATIKASGKNCILLIPNVVTKYGLMVEQEGKKVQVESGLNKLLHKAINYEIERNNGDANRVYIMGAGSGVGDVLCELSLSADTYAAAVLAFGEGYYRNIDNYSNLTFEVVSASDDLEYDAKEISNMVEDIKETGATVNYQDLDGKPAQVAKTFFKNTEWLDNIFAASK